MKKLILIATFFFALQVFMHTALAASPTPEPDPSASPSVAPAKVNPNELFWPISAGKVAGDKMYSLKLMKEKLRGSLIFSKPKKMEYFVTLSTKRVVEAEKLYLTNKDYENAKKSLQLSQENREEALEILNSLNEKGKPTDVVKGGFRDVLERQKKLLEYIHSQVPESEKEAISNNLNNLNEIWGKLQ